MFFFFSCCRPSYEWLRNLSVHQPNKLHPSKKISLAFDNIKADILAQQLTFLEFKAFRRITVRHLIIHNDDVTISQKLPLMTS